MTKKSERIKRAREERYLERIIELCDRIDRDDKWREYHEYFDKAKWIDEYFETLGGLYLKCGRTYWHISFPMTYTPVDNYIFRIKAREYRAIKRQWEEAKKQLKIE